MADVEPELKSRARPTSMMAQRFSMLLDSSFGLDETTESVIKKKEEVASQAAELEELQARLAAMEEKLSASKVEDIVVPAVTESSHSRSRSMAQKPYLRGPIALSVRPETPKASAKPEPVAQKQVKAPAPQQTSLPPLKRFLSMRRRQRPEPEKEESEEEEEEDEEEEESSEEEEEDSDGSSEEDDDSETSSSEEPPRRK